MQGGEAEFVSMLNSAGSNIPALAQLNNQMRLGEQQTSYLDKLESDQKRRDAEKEAEYKRKTNPQWYGRTGNTTEAPVGASY